MRDWDTTRPRAMAGTLQALLLGPALSPPGRARLLGWMENRRAGVRGLRARPPSAWRVADKTGRNGADAVGDVALIRAPRPGWILAAPYVQGGRPEAADVETLFAGLSSLVANRFRNG